MTNKEAIEIIERLFIDSTDENYPFTEDFCTACTVAVRALEQTKWIPAHEDVPYHCAENKLYDMVRVQFDDGTLGLGVYREGDDNRWWTRKDEGDMKYTPENYVVAWQPLPEPWEGENK